ncbi:hypothetical protein PR003_g31627 [Phytophthora rubi]|uniref:Uncharacterized protein n=1 Tax=Phytophthora rubi TaxID=129364 RepID=A0A6A4BAJ6_9STRA|nr:hypothetical protein PR003_g31628 [Phytophthora rubi]KAE9267884.1 hypothetical protein PR003_g31627 [Phytophthora rubi]
MLSAPGGTATSAFLGTSDRTRSSSAAHLEALRRLPFSARANARALQAQRTLTHHVVCLSWHKQFKLSAPGGTATSAFLGTSDRTRSSSAAHLEAPRRLPFSPQVQAHKKFKHTAPGGPTTSAFLGPGLSSAHLEAP